MVPNNDALEKCIKEILSQIKPAEVDRNKRLSAIKELDISIQSVAALKGAAAKPFGSFLSNLYSKSGDLDLSVQLMNSSNLPVSKKKKQSILRVLRKALQRNGVAGYMEFIPHARVPVLQYVSNSFGISCDLSIDNYPGRIKSRIFYWISTLDERFGDMVLLIKEWAKCQNINDPKTGTLNSYSLCLLVLFHFQTCEPEILPPLKDIYEGNITEDFTDMTLYDEEHLDMVCAANIAKFESQNKEQRNESSLCQLLATFFDKFCHINAITNDVISTYTGQLEKIQDNPNWMKKSYSLFIEDPVERPDNAARAVGVRGLLQIASAFNDTNRKFVSLERTEKNDLLGMLCTPDVCSKLGGRVIASHANTPQRNHHHARSMVPVGAKLSDNQRHHGARGFTGSRPAHNPTQVYLGTTGCQTAGQLGQYQNHDHSQPYTNTAGRQTAGQPGLYRNNYRQTPAAYTAYTGGHQTLDQHPNQSYPQAHTPWVPTGQYQNHYPPQAFATGHQAAGSYQQAPAYHYQSQPQFHAIADPTPGSYHQNGYYNNQSLYDTGRQAEGLYRNQRGRQYTPDRQGNRSGATTRYAPVAAGLQNGLPQNSRSQTSRRTEWQGSSQHHT